MVKLAKSFKYGYLHRMDVFMKVTQAQMKDLKKMFKVWSELGESGMSGIVEYFVDGANGFRPMCRVNLYDKVFQLNSKIEEGSVISNENGKRIYYLAYDQYKRDIKRHFKQFAYAPIINEDLEEEKKSNLYVTMDVYKYQAMALLSMFRYWNELGESGRSEIVGYYVDGINNFKPKCRIHYYNERDCRKPLDRDVNRVPKFDKSSGRVQLWTGCIPYKEK